MRAFPLKMLVAVEYAFSQIIQKENYRLDDRTSTLEASFDRPLSMNSLLSFGGRVPRSVFWVVQLITAVIIFFINMVTPDSPGLRLFLLLVLAVPQTATAVKRYHDRDKSGWWILVSLVPLIGPLWTAVELGFFRGTSGPNRFGPDPVG